MKTIEEKVKAYDEAIKVIKDNLDALNEITETGADVVNIQSIRNCFYRAFPELKESKDEKIRKEIISTLKFANFKGVYNKHLAWLEKQGKKKTKEYTFKSLPRLLDMIEPTERAKSYCEKLIESLQTEGYATDAKIVGDCLKQMYGEKVGMATMDTWFEKQGEKLQGKSALEAIKEEEKGFDEKKYVKDWLEKNGGNTYKVEPKFKVGDWVVTDKDTTVQIDAVSNGYYTINNGMDFSISYVDKHWRLWTIKDAKNGDVLVDEDNNIGLYKEEKDYPDDLYWNSCIYLGCDNYLRGFNIGGYHIRKNTHPATEEQRVLLFTKMKEEGYEWDADKKKLWEIE